MPTPTISRGGPVRVAVDHLAPGPDDGRGGEHGGTLHGHGVGVGGGERRAATPALVHRAAAAARREDHDHVGAQRLELPLHQPAGALADRDHRRHRRDADHDAQHGQRRPASCSCPGPAGRREWSQDVTNRCMSMTYGFSQPDSGHQLLAFVDRVAGTTSVNWLSLRPVVTSTARADLSSTTQTCRRLRFLPASARSDGRTPLGDSRFSVPSSVRDWSCGAFQQRRSSGRTCSGLGIEPQRRVGNLQHVLVLARSGTRGWPSCPAAASCSGLAHFNHDRYT